MNGTLGKKAHFFQTRPDGGWRIRSAGVEDREALVTLRRALFQEMGYGDEDLLDRVADASDRYLATAMPRGEFRAWVAEAGGEVVASGGLVFHAGPPTATNLDGVEGYIMNVYTRPGWRRRGIATAILQAILHDLRGQGIPLASLHTTPSGQAIYERAGFQPSPEMRLLLESEQDARVH